MNKDLINFMNNLTIKEDISKYKDEKGNIMYIPTNMLYANCSYLTLTEEEYNQALFNGSVQKKEYNKTKIKRPTPKNKITGKEEDKTTIVEQDVDAYEIWVVSNNLGFMSSFDNRKEAVEFVEKIEGLI